MASLAIKDLSFTYPMQEIPALNHINLTVLPGEFLLLCGRSGCGKTTLMRQFKTALTPHGKREGEIFFNGMPLESLEGRAQADKIGYVMQNPDNQIVTDKVWHELSFGLESLGFDSKTIRLRVAEMASFFGIQEWFHRDVAELSGGQKQLLNLASVMAMQPEVLLLDEPTSQLDPIAALDFLETVKRINRELGTTVVISEQRLEEVMPMADRVVVMAEGTILADGAPRQVGRMLYQRGNAMFAAMPAAMRLAAGVNGDKKATEEKEEEEYPLTVREGRAWLNRRFADQAPARTVLDLPAALALRESESESENERENILQLKEVWFRYERNQPDVIKDLSFTVKKGQFYTIVGGNGTGKTTALSLICGLYKPYRGKVFFGSKDIGKYTNGELFDHNLALLPQNPQALFVKKTVELDLLEILNQTKLSPAEKIARVRQMAATVEIEDLLQAHPYDLSGGEQQRAALAKVLLLEPKLLLLDEPTKGLDSYFKEKLAAILKKLLVQDVTIVMVSHDIEFCGRYAHHCALFFDGSIVSDGMPRQFFAGNSFYTTAANRISRHLFENAVTTEDVIALCQQNL